MSQDKKEFGQLGDIKKQIDEKYSHLSAAEKEKLVIGKVEGKLGKTEGNLGKVEGKLGKTEGNLGKTEGNLGKFEGDSKPKKN